MEKERILKLLLSIVLSSTAVLKLVSLSYVVNVLFTVLPIGLLDTFIAAHLQIIVMAESIVELSLAGILWTSWSSFGLKFLFGFLIFMLLLNSYQWVSGVEDCGCFGKAVKLSPGITFLKTFLLIAVTGILLKKGFGSKVLSKYKS